MKDIVIQLLAAFFGGLGVALLFGMRSRHLLPAAIGGVLAWGVYLGVDALIHSDFLACLVASAFAVIYAEMMARWRKTPATLFVIPGIVPLVPGSSLYNTMSCVVRGEMAGAKNYGTKTLLCALAIAAGISIVTALREIQTKKQ
ncbi:MAG: threonine/serine exporter family protein [Oscillospiraceae bacterium]|nr:threonine/serine exporter family protein [Oscillospiraceae bacterium]